MSVESNFYGQSGNHPYIQEDESPEHTDEEEFDLVDHNDITPKVPTINTVNTNMTNPGSKSSAQTFMKFKASDSERKHHTQKI